MPPSIARLVFVLGILVLIFLDRDRDSTTSSALWIPIAWVFIGASRMLSEWLGGGGPMDSPDQYLDGSPLDAAILTGLLIAGLMVLAARGRPVAALLRKNWPIVLFFLYCGLSALWSDFPLVTFKRWTKSLGNVAMIFIVLTDPHPAAAVKRLLAVTGFLLIPTSVLLIKYYPALGRGYDRWVGTAYYNGITAGKNSLGCDCLVFGLAGLSRVFGMLRESNSSGRMRRLLAQGTLVAMVLWLFYLVDSATSLACFMVGGMLIILLTRSGAGRPATVHFLFGTIAITALLFFTVLDGKTHIIEALGRDATLTGRTELWDDVLRMNRHPLFGTGFESFFLGDRARYLWNKYWWHPNEAHNGYIETVVNLGWIGAGFLIVVIVSGYRNAVAAYRTDSTMGALRLAMLVVALIYNLTEAAFKVMNPMWIAFLWTVAAVPGLPQEKEGETVVQAGQSRPLLDVRRRAFQPVAIKAGPIRMKEHERFTRAWPWPAARQR